MEPHGVPYNAEAFQIVCHGRHGGVIVTHDRVVCFCRASIALKCAGRAFGRYWSQEGKKRRGISQEEARGDIELFCYLCLQLTFLSASFAWFVFPFPPSVWNLNLQPASSLCACDRRERKTSLTDRCSRKKWRRHGAFFSDSNAVTIVSYLCLSEEVQQKWSALAVLEVVIGLKFYSTKAWNNIVALYSSFGMFQSRYPSPCLFPGHILKKVFR